MKMEMNIEQSWEDKERENPKYSEENLSTCYFVHHKSQMDYPDIEPGIRQRKAGE
jgi:hypothetical protein